MKQPLSIITAIHNGLAMNRLYWKALTAQTESPFELIIVDNHSTDGSEKFFKNLSEQTRGSSQEVIYIRNEKNQSYPQSQIQGMQSARYDVFCFLNNDIWMQSHWDRAFVALLQVEPLLVLSPSGQEAQPTQKASEQLKNQWKRAVFFSRLWAFFLRRSEEQRLWKALEFMYGDLKNFRSPTDSRERTWMPGIKGDSVILHRALVERVPKLWDERIEAADWHLYLTLAKLHEQDPSIPLPRVLLEVYIHHFGRYSAKQKFEPLENKEGFLSIDSVWGKENIARLWWANFLPE